MSTHIFYHSYDKVIGRTLHHTVMGLFVSDICNMYTSDDTMTYRTGSYTSDDTIDIQNRQGGTQAEIRLTGDVIPLEQAPLLQCGG